MLELKKSQNVLFAGIDRPDDIVNLTHQELFSKGGFVVFEGAALDTLSLSMDTSQFAREQSAFVTFHYVSTTVNLYKQL